MFLEWSLKYIIPTTILIAKKINKSHFICKYLVIATPKEIDDIRLCLCINSKF